MGASGAASVGAGATAAAAGTACGAIPGPVAMVKKAANVTSAVAAPKTLMAEDIGDPFA
jgi:hypothetical protein